jgi:hypothetical protein
MPLYLSFVDNEIFEHEEVKSHAIEVLDRLLGVVTMGSPWSLNEVFRRAGTPVRDSNSLSKR